MTAPAVDSPLAVTLSAATVRALREYQAAWEVFLLFGNAPAGQCVEEKQAIWDGFERARENLAKARAVVAFRVAADARAAGHYLEPWAPGVSEP